MILFKYPFVSSIFLIWIVFFSDREVVAQHSSVVFYPFTAPEKPVSIVEWNQRLLLITQRAVYRIEKHQLALQTRFEAPVQTAVVDEESLWIGTRKGLFIWNKDQPAPLLVPLPAMDTSPAIQQLTLDTHHSVWIATQQYGVFREDNGRIIPALAVYPVSTVASTADGSVWVGTNAGLYQSTNGKDWNRYAEEGITGFEIPDNIVDQLFSKNDSILWVVMPNAITFINTRENLSGHAPSYDYLGAPDNEIHDVIRLRAGVYLAATRLGVILLPAPPEHAHDHEGLREIQPDLSQNSAVLLTSIEIQTPEALPGEKPFILHEDSSGNVWLACSTGIWQMGRKGMHQLIKNKTAQKRVKP